MSDIEFMNTWPFTIHFKISNVCFKVIVKCNTCKIFNPCNYASDDIDRITNIELWFQKILLKFQYNEEESDMCKG